MNNGQSSFFCNHALFVLNHNTLNILDANEAAIEFYGYSRDEFCQMSIYDLGEKKDRSALIIQENDEFANDKIWVHQTKCGEEVYVQFTSHIFSHNGKPAKLATAHNVTEQVNNQEKRLSKFPQIQLYKGNRPLAEIIWDAEKRVLKWSEKAEKLFGWSKKEVLRDPKFFNKFMHKEELDQANQMIDDNVAALKHHYTTNGRVHTKTGDVRVCEWHNTLVYDENGSLLSVYTLVQDISERKKSEDLFKALAEESLVGVYLIQNGTFKYVNPCFADIFNYAKGEIEGTLGPLDLTHRDDSKLVAENLKQRMNGGADSIQYDFRCLTKNRETIHVKVFGTKIDYLGKPAIVGTLLDITHSKLAFERYQASVESFEDLFDSISDAIYIQDKEEQFIKVNKAALELNGYDREFLIGKQPDVLAAKGKTDLKKAQEHFKKALDGTPQKFEQWGRRKNGEVFPEEVVLNPGTYFGEEVVIAIARDISKQHEVEDEIQKSREKFEQLFQNAPVSIVMMDKNQHIRTVNRAFENTFGYIAEEIEGLNVDKVIVPKGKERQAQKLSKQVFEGDASSISARRETKNGELVDVLIYGVPVYVNGETIAIYGIYVDITERKKAEEKIKKSLKEKEVLLAEIHHRVKNNLAVIAGLLELQQFKADSKEARNILRESQLRINSIALIHEKLYQNENLSEVSIDVYLKELLDIIVSSMATEVTDVSISIDSASIFLTINQAIPCGLILNELITNVYKHAFEGRKTGDINIKLKQEDETFLLCVEDNGRGMPENIDYDNPSTLGLTLIQTLSNQLRGSCNFENQENGMRFNLEFEIDK
jgi:PAS domain S-box-containing protein